MIDSTDGTLIRSYTYGYDALGNITSVSGSRTASYQYDDQNQLIYASEGTSQSQTVTTYTYDAAGNMLTKTRNGVTDTFTYNDNNGWKDLLTAYNGNPITYDGIGNPTSYYDGTAFTWVNGRRLASASRSGLAVSYTYDADGLRLSKTVNGVEHKYVWQGGRLISEQYGTTTLEFFYDEAGNPFSFTLNGTPYFYVTNLQGDVTAIVNLSGDNEAIYNYDAFGKIASMSYTTVSQANPLRYRGYYFDSETGFYYLKSRYYDPTICRFINADGYASTGQGFIGTNMFAYCGNNPICNIDYNGNKYIENHFIDPYIVDGELRGFNVKNDERFLDIDYCIGFAEEYIEKEGVNGKVAGMTAKRIALELYAHAELYYYALSIPDPSDNSKNPFYSSVNEYATFGNAVVSFVKSYLIDHGETITVNNDESAFRMKVYKAIWRNKTGKKYKED